MQSSHYTWQHTSSLPKCQLSEECCASSELSGVDSPAQLSPSCSAMSTIFWSALSVLLREPGGEEGVTAQLHRALHHRPVGTALPCRQDQGNLQGKGSCCECNYDRIIPAFPLAWAPQVQVVSGLEWSQQAAYRNWSHLECCIAPAETMASVSSFAHHCHFPVKVVTNQGVNSLKRGQQLCPDTTASPSAPEWYDMEQVKKKADSKGCPLHLEKGWALTAP